ncbi:MFS transporter [Homoserinibacter sp. YIM 151385]|uniref:MFS transporter n=1 Tax=Homoserinibacter sp. YIM 151385 TaxID=2985506 RepID=UPI0022F11622|nr:MFS transporter [Homoserinibacter sp. YIM 151385]WBU38963.1 MFS transporter [Homoserinibacter sp. YIM 151385]
MDRRERLVVAVAVLASVVPFLDGTVTTVALPAIDRELGGGLAGQQWVVDAYLVTLGALILVAGAASDVLGRILVLRAGLVGFGATSLVIALAPSIEVLIVARALQGVAGALLVPSSLALITANFAGPARGRAIGVWTGMTSGAMVLGPLVGGVFVDLLSWRLAFLINVPIAGLVIWLLARLGQRDERRPGARIDALGAVLCTLGLGGPVFALIEQERLGWAHPGVLVALAGGVLAFAGFLLRQRTAPQPMMPLSLFRERDFAVGNIATLFVYAALSLNGFALGVYLQTGAGLPATLAGLASLPITVIMILGSSRVGALAGRIGPRPFMAAGPVVMAAGSLLLLTVGERFDYWWQVLPAMLLIGAGLTLTVSPLTSAILGAVETDRSGIASAVNNAVSRVAGLVVIALLGIIVGGQLDLAGFQRAAVATAALLAAGGVVSLLGIRSRPRADPAEDAAAERVSP